MPDALWTYRIAAEAIGRGRLSRDPMTTRELGEANSDLQEAREELRVDRLAQVNKWLANDSPLRNQSKGAFMLDEEEVEEFLVIVNDRRLLLAMEKQLDRTHLDQDLLEVKQPELQQCLLEIHFLASVQYVILESL